MVCEMTPDKERELYGFFIANRADVPYYFPVSFDAWRDSMFRDTDVDGRPLWSELNTLLLMDDGAITGFIQFGLTSFVFDENGGKDVSGRYGVIRNLYYRQGDSGAAALIDKAHEYFALRGVERRYAFFHYFGMSCYARQGKLHASEFYIEELLRAYGYRMEHENVYYSKALTENGAASPGIDFVYGDGGVITFFKDGNRIGDCSLNFVTGDLCYLMLIGIDAALAHQGYGTQCMNKLFFELRQKGITRLDTDTAHNNLNAQGYYRKMGFTDMGRMRSYASV